MWVSPGLEAVVSEPSAVVECALLDIVYRAARAENTAWMMDRFTRFYDLLYVHGDPRLFRLQDSFPESPAVAARLHYTGFVTEADTVVAAARARCAEAGQIGRASCRERVCQDV